MLRQKKESATRRFIKDACQDEGFIALMITLVIVILFFIWIITSHNEKMMIDLIDKQHQETLLDEFMDN